METSNHNFFDRFNHWLRESVMIKLLSIGFLLLILLIPANMVSSIMEERQDRALSVMSEVGDTWSGPQTLAGPVIRVPYQVEETIDEGNGKLRISKYTRHAFFMPDQLQITGKVKPQELHRGIFDAVVYESEVSMTASFGKPLLDVCQCKPQDYNWNEATLLLGISDLRGISENPVIAFNGTELASEPSGDPSIWSAYPISDDESIRDNMAGIQAPLALAGDGQFSSQVTVKLNLKGHEKLYFVPGGKTTEVNLTGDWSNPSFEGKFLPVSRQTEKAPFQATWKVLHYNRPFNQAWTKQSDAPIGSDFGVRLIVPVDQYQKSIRTAKYASLLILLTFIALFMVEIIRGIRIHPVQYILIGAALIIYYVLLLSLSEHLGFDMAYGLAAGATVVLVTAYASIFLKPRVTLMLFGALLVFFNSFIFVIIQLQDYALLLGSVGLFAVIALLMYFSRKIDWYKEKQA